jgi:hypothetical protein
MAAGVCLCCVTQYHWWESDDEYMINESRSIERILEREPTQEEEAIVTCACFLSRMILLPPWLSKWVVLWIRAGSRVERVGTGVVDAEAACGCACPAAGVWMSVRIGKASAHTNKVSRLVVLHTKKYT